MNETVKNLTGMYILQDGDMDVIVYTYNVVDIATGRITQMGVQEEIQMLSGSALRTNKVTLTPEVTAIETLRGMVRDKLNS